MIEKMLNEGTWRVLARKGEKITTATGLEVESDDDILEVEYTDTIKNRISLKQLEQELKEAERLKNY